MRPQVFTGTGRRRNTAQRWKYAARPQWCTPGLAQRAPLRWECTAEHTCHSQKWLADRQRGSAVAEFVLVSALLALVFGAIVQLGLAIHVRNTVTDSALAGARVGAMVDAGPEDATQLTRDLISATIGDQYAQEIDVHTETYNGTELVVVTVRTPVPVVGLLGPRGLWELKARALRESVTGSR